MMSNTIATIPGLTLLNYLNSTGGYAWIHCEGLSTCQEEFNKVNITGISGTSFGASDQGILIIQPIIVVSFLRHILMTT